MSGPHIDRRALEERSREADEGGTTYGERWLLRLAEGFPVEVKEDSSRRVPRSSSVPLCVYMICIRK
jgi:hypothetical protein